MRGTINGATLTACAVGFESNPRGFEPFWFDKSWLGMIENKKILVITSLSESIKLQSSKLDLVWNNGLFPPNPDINVYRIPFNSKLTGVAPVGTWTDKLKQIQSDISKIDFDVAFVGAGAWSIPIVSDIKTQGKVGIHMGGGLQILFGVIGKRWAEREDFKDFFNQHWITPLDEDIPPLVKMYRSGDRAPFGSVDVDAYW